MWFSPCFQGRTKPPLSLIFTAVRDAGRLPEKHKEDQRHDRFSLPIRAGVSIIELQQFYIKCLHFLSFIVPACSLF